jgi:hypothetical protein
MKLNFTINKTKMTKKKILIIEDDNIIKIMDYVLKRRLRNVHIKDGNDAVEQILFSLI